MNLDVFLICKDADCDTFTDSRAAVLKAAQEAVAELKNAPTAGSVFYYTSSLNSQVAKTAGVTNAPTVLITDHDTGRVLATITGNPINAVTVKARIKELALQGYQTGEGGTGIFPGGTPGGDLLGLGLFNLNWKLPHWIWLALAGAAAYKAATSKLTRCKVVFGSAALVAGLNWWNKQGVAGIGMLPEMASDSFDIDATGDVVTGDVIRFDEAVFGGSHRNPSLKGHRTITARVVKDSYGADKQQHTFSLVILRSEGTDADKYPAGSKTTRKGRNVYRNRVMRQRWQDESLRHQVATEKHARGDAARARRQIRWDEKDSMGW